MYKYSQELSLEELTELKEKQEKVVNSWCKSCIKSQELGFYENAPHGMIELETKKLRELEKRIAELKSKHALKKCKNTNCFICHN